MGTVKEGILSCLDYLIATNEIKSTELKRYIAGTAGIEETDELRNNLEEWYRCAGFEHIVGRKLVLSECPFTKQEIIEATENDEIILCIPRDVSRQQIADMFGFKSWAVSDKLATQVVEKEDLWFKTSRSLKPVDMKITGWELVEKTKELKKIGYSLERYMIFIARIRYLYGVTPDQEYWVWIPQGRYDRSGMLIAGFDRTGNFNVHGWMPQFSGSFLGARYGEYPNNTVYLS